MDTNKSLGIRIMEVVEGTVRKAGFQDVFNEIKK